jgi:hypothetical protein
MDMDFSTLFDKAEPSACPQARSSSTICVAQKLASLRQKACMKLWFERRLVIGTGTDDLQH